MKYEDSDKTGWTQMKAGKRRDFFTTENRSKRPFISSADSESRLAAKTDKPSASLCVAAVETLVMVRVFYISRLNLPVLLVSAFPLLSAVPSAIALWRRRKL
jgi:hypothetical protein